MKSMHSQVTKLWKITCSFCGDTTEESAQELATEALKEFKAKGWTSTDTFPALCPDCTKLTNR